MRFYNSIFALLLVLLFVTSSLAQDPNAQIGSEAKTPVVSPDGTKILFSSDASGDSDIWIANFNGSNVRPLASWVGSEEESPDWSPDGNTIIFSSTRNEGKNNIWTVNKDGSASRQLTSNSTNNTQPRYSPDGSQVIFVSNRTGRRELWLMGSSGSNQSAIGAVSQIVSDPAWSPNGQEIVYVGCGDGACNLFAITTDGAISRQITSGDFNDWQPDWSSDGIVFASDRENLQALWVVRPDGSNLHVLTEPGPTGDMFPRWDRKTGAVVFSRAGLKDDLAGSNIWVVQAGGGSETQIIKLCTPEVCNGIDDDCNGQIDDGLGNLSCGIGACSRTVAACVNGVTQVCTPGQPVAEICDSLDNNCDGAVDENNPGGGASCTTGLPGVCEAGTQVCTGGALTCQQTAQPSTESCDGLDNNCNGTVDEGNPGGGASCSTGLFGLCAAGTQACSNGGLSCQQTTQPGVEICGNNIDEDCNGSDLACPPPPPVDACTPTTVLDNFNRADGSVGTNWRGVTGTSFYRVAGNRLDVQAGGPLYWNSATFGTSQAVFITLNTVDTKSPSQGMLLKVQSGTVPDAGAISVVYDATAKAVRVSTLRLGTLTWTPYGNTSVLFNSGDKLGACAKANGEVRVYKNDTLVKTVTLNTADQGFFNPKGGKVGVWSVLAPQAFLDDFGGATITP